jgi:hypothetical protein
MRGALEHRELAARIDAGCSSENGALRSLYEDLRRADAGPRRTRAGWADSMYAQFRDYARHAAAQNPAVRDALCRLSSQELEHFTSDLAEVVEKAGLSQHAKKLRSLAPGLVKTARVMEAVEPHLAGRPDLRERLHEIVGRALNPGLHSLTKTSRPRFEALLMPHSRAIGEFMRALASAVHGREDALVWVEGPRIRDYAELFSYFGAPPGFMSWGESESALTKANLDAKFGSQGPCIVLIDGLDRIGGGDPKLHERFLKQLVQAKIQNPIVVMTHQTPGWELSSSWPGSHSDAAARDRS